MTSSDTPAALISCLTARVRAAFLLLVSLIVVGGGLIYPKFSSKLRVDVAPPAGSPSGIGRHQYEKYFPSTSLEFIAHLRSVDGSSLVNNNSAGFEPAQAVSAALKKRVDAMSGTEAGKCTTTFVSYWDLPPILAPLLTAQLLTRNDSEALMVASISACSSMEDGVTTSHPIQPDCITRKVPYCAPAAALLDEFHDYADSGSYGEAISVEIASMPDVFHAALSGVDQTMVVSTMTAPIALGLLGSVLRNARLLLITLANIVATMTSTVIVMYFVSCFWGVSSQAPSLILATSLGMTIDYSLFLLSRFGTEVHQRRRPVREACITMLATSGHTVLVSGMTLCLCFLGMLLVPVSTIASMGVSAAVTVFFGISFALLLTPTLLLACPRFFTANRRLGFTCDCGVPAVSTAPADGFADKHINSTMGDALLDAAPPEPAAPMGLPGTAGLAQPAAHAPSSSATTQIVGSSEDASSSTSLEGLHSAPHVARGVWAKLGDLVQRPWLALIVLISLGGMAVPFAQPLFDLTYVEGLQPLLPRGSPSTHNFLDLQQSFGVSNVFPNTILIVPPRNKAVEDPAWLHTACGAMHDITSDVTQALQAQGIDYTMNKEDMTGLMTYGGHCIGWIEAFLEIAAKASGDKRLKSALEGLIDAFGNSEHTATKVSAATRLDPFSAHGRAWIAAMRDAITKQQAKGAGTLGEIYFTGIAQEQMDGAADTFHALPRVVGATLGIVCVVLLCAFRSLVLPLRAVLCLVLMLIVTFGSAALVYQQGALGDLSIPMLEPTGGALFWMSPCISFSIVVGLGLDYDIFLTESVIEYYDAGASPREALSRALDATGNIICVAGIIMTLAFGALLAGNSAALNQIGYLLIVGVLMDCFVTTKIVIPCAMALLPGDINFWPRKKLLRHCS